MIRLAIVVEGRTDEEFVNRVIAPHLRARGVEPTPILIGGGGNVTVGRLASEIADLFWSFERVTSLVDFYGFRDMGDDEVKNHPSRRIKDLMPAYHKAVDGPFLADRMGLPTIRAECPRFDQWVVRMETLGFGRSRGGVDRNSP